MYPINKKDKFIIFRLNLVRIGGAFGVCSIRNYVPILETCVRFLIKIN